MKESKYNMIFDVGDEKIIFNPHSGAMDILNEDDLKILNKIKMGKKIDSEYIEPFIERGYVFETAEKETEQLMKSYNKFKQIVSRRGEKYVLPITYDCNHRCTYCFQDEPMRKPQVMKETIIEKAFESIDVFHKNKETPTVSLFGGEPLMKKTEQAVISIVEKSEQRNYDLIVSTNGFELEYYADILEDATQIQVTMDGTKEYHDKRRIAINGESSFEKIVKGVDVALDKNIPIALRINVDKDNIENLPELADFIIQKQWIDKGIKPYIAAVRNVSCTDYGQCIPEHNVLEKVFKCYEKHPETRILSLNGWQGVDSLTNLIKGKGLFPPQFKQCEANIDMLALDLYGDIYTCLEVVGKKKWAVGRFYPELDIDENKFKQWRERDIFKTGCVDCEVALSCGGGCAILAYEKIGSLDSHYCKPVKRALELAIPFYYSELKKLSEVTV